MRGRSEAIAMLNPDFRDMLSALSARGADYMVVGAYALAYHGLPRATGDIDIWVRCSQENAERVLGALTDFGAPRNALSIEDLRTPDMVIQIGVAPRRIDILTSIDGVGWEEASQQVLLVGIEGLTIPIIGKRHLIENKRASGRPKDLVDLAWLERGEQ
jgi:hypothetical protein